LPRFAGLRTSYALFIIILMVVGIAATASFLFYNSGGQNPCGTPASPQFAAAPDQTITVDGQPKTYFARSANFTGTGQTETIAGVTFSSTAFNDPSVPHLVNGNCVSDPSTPVTITVRVSFASGGQYDLLLSYKGSSQPPAQSLTPDGQAALYWNGAPWLYLLVSCTQSGVTC
jgi:hypothetical protein